MDGGRQLLDIADGPPLGCPTQMEGVAWTLTYLQCSIRAQVHRRGLKEITTPRPVGRGKLCLRSSIEVAQVTMSGEIIRVNQANTCPCVHGKYLFQRIWREGLDRGGKVNDQKSGITVQ